MAENDNGRVSLARLSEQVAALARSVDRLEANLESSKARRDTEMKELKANVYAMKESMIEARGGRKMLYGLLAAAAGIGAFISELIQKVVPVLK